MQRFTLLALVLLLLGCNSGEFKPVLHQELKGDGGIQAWLNVNTRPSDKYWYVGIDIPNISQLVIGPEDHYARQSNQYEMWEKTVQNNWSTLRGMTNGAARTSVRMQMRNAQSQMRSIRQNAQIDGVHILASPWETASVPYGLDD